MTKNKKNIESVTDLLSFVKKNYSSQKDEVIEKYNLNGTSQFNIFETISDSYLREKFHSDILFSILDSNTPEIGIIYNKEILKEFVNMVDSSFNFIVDDTVKVSKEESNKVMEEDDEKQGYIDLLIINAHNQAIIIENKIKDAPDMENQLVRYMEYVKKQKFGKSMADEDFKKNVRVVYLTLVPGKFPKIDEYSDSFAGYKKMLSDAKSGKDGEILKYRSAVDNKEARPDLVTFLDSCVKFFDAETDDKSLLKKVYLEQYKCLLNHIGGDAKMENCQKKLLQEIYSSQENFKAAQEIIEVLNNEKVVNDFINDCLKKIVEPLFSLEEDKMFKYWNKTHDCFLYVYGIETELEIGFGKKEKDFKSKEQEKYLNVLSTISQMEGEVVTEDKYTYVLIRIKPLSGKNSMEEFLKYYYTKFIPKLIKEGFEK